MQPSPPFEEIANRLGASLISTKQLLGGSSAVVHALGLKMAAGNVEHVVVRQHRANDFKGHAKTVAQKEFQVLKRLRRLGFLVPGALLVDEANAWLVTEWIEGTTDVAATTLNGALQQMARFLSSLHCLDPAELALDTLPMLEDPVASIDAYMPDTAAGLHLGAAIKQGVIQVVANPRRLIHGDYWPGNMLWRDGQLGAVIDWEDAHLGDPLADLAGARIELKCQYGSHAMDYFTEQYLEATDLDLTSLPLWEAYVSSAALATMHLWALGQAEEQQRRTTTTAFFDRAAAELLDDPTATG